MFLEEHWLDENGNPAGGVSSGTGITISWQNGPLGRDNDRRAPNGAFVETVAEMMRGRLEFYQTASGGRFACAENAEMIEHVDAIIALERGRTARREAAKVEGTHQGA